MSKEGGDVALTVSKCQNTCYLANLKYAGTKAGVEYWYSDYVAGSISKNQTDCSISCSGDKGKVCGGKDTINVFKPVALDDLPVSTGSKSTSVTAIKSISSVSIAMKLKSTGSVGKVAQNDPADSGASRNLAFSEVFVLLRLNLGFLRII